MFLGVSFETYLRRHGDVLIGRRHYASLRRRHDIPIRRREDIPLGRLGDIPLRCCWVFHLRRTCDVAGTYRETSFLRRHDVLLPGGNRLIMQSKCPVCGIKNARFVKEQEIKVLLSNLGIKTPTSKIPLLSALF